MFRNDKLRKIYPHYDESNDYNTNAKSYLDYLAKANKLYEILAERIWEYEEKLNLTLEEINDKLTSYIQQNEDMLFDMLTKWDERIDNLDDEVSDIFVTWLNDGTLEQIINHDVLGNKADKSYVDDLNESVTAQLAQTMGRTQISPDDFEGTDIEKLQQVYDYAVEHDVNTISLTREYDITGGYIDLGDTYFPYKQLIFKGGKIVKNDEGYIFDATTVNRSRNSPQFKDTIFSTTSDGVYVFNGDRMIRHHMVNCLFHKVGLVHSTGYVQTIRLTDCETGLLGCDFIKAKNSFDIEVKGHKGEQTSSPYHFMNLLNDQPSSISFFGLRISGLWEGYSNVPPFNLGTGYGLDMEGVYFEANNGSVHFDRGNGLGATRLSGSIKDCVFGANKSQSDITIDSGIQTNHLVIEGNTTTASSTQSFISRGVSSAVDKNNLSGGASLFDKDNVRALRTENTSYRTSVVNDDGVKYEFTIPTNNVGSIGNNGELQFLVTIKGNYGTNPNYRGHLVGILSIDTFNVSNVATSELMFTVLSTRSTDGHNSGGLDRDEVFDYYFKTSGDKRELPNVKDPTIVFHLPNFVQHPNRNTIHVQALGGMLHQYVDNY